MPKQFFTRDGCVFGSIPLRRRGFIHFGGAELWLPRVRLVMLLGRVEEVWSPMVREFAHYFLIRVKWMCAPLAHATEQRGKRERIVRAASVAIIESIDVWPTSKLRRCGGAVSELQNGWKPLLILRGNADLDRLTRSMESTPRLALGS